MKNYAQMMILFLLPILVGFNSCHKDNRSEDNAENTVIISDNTLNTDDSEDLSNITDISIIDNSGYSEQFYFPDDAHEYISLPGGTMVDTSLDKEVIDMFLRRFEAIENGDLPAFRSTLPSIEDGVDFYYQLSLVHKYFGDLLNIDADTFNSAVETSDGLQTIAYALFTEEPPARNRNTGLFLKKIEAMPSGGIMVTVINNRNEEDIHYFMYN